MDFGALNELCKLLNYIPINFILYEEDEEPSYWQFLVMK